MAVVLSKEKESMKKLYFKAVEILSVCKVQVGMLVQTYFSTMVRKMQLMHPI